MISIDDLVTPLTEDQILEKLLDIIETIGLRARSWRKAGAYRTILRAVAGVAASFSDKQAQFIRSGFLELAEGQWLTWVAWYVYGVLRPAATFATGTVTLTNLGGGDYLFASGTLSVFNATLKKAFRNQDPIHLAPLATLTDVNVIAVEIGSASSSVTGAIDDVDTSYEGQIDVTNPSPVIGSDAMPDADLRQLCKDKLFARSVFGPRGAYAYAARSATRLDGSTVDINRVSISPSSSTGIVTMVVASPSGVPTSDDVDAVRANCETIARPDTVTLNLSGATGNAITRSVTIWAKKQTGLTPADLTALANAAILALNRSYPIGGIRKGASQGYFWADNLDGAIQAAHPSIYSVDGCGADVALANAEIPVLDVTVAQVRIVDPEVH